MDDPNNEDQTRNEISIDQFLELDLRVARVISAEPVDGADKLLKLRVDLGNQERQLVAGVAQVYEPQALVGKKIIVVANLKTARIRGVESQGMLLAADVAGRPVLPSFEEEVPAGAPVR